MKLAVDAATGSAEPPAWTHIQLGKLYFNHGRSPRRRARVPRSPSPIFPGYAYGLDALAPARRRSATCRAAIALRAAGGRPRSRCRSTSARSATCSAPTASRAAARQQYALIGAIEKLLRANGVRADLEIALFDVDHGIRAAARARAGADRARAERPSIDGDDVLGWALARNGRCAEALAYSQHALRLGTQDALKFFHRGMIERCLGHAGAARAWFGRALALNPHFSMLWAPVARRYAA